MAKAKPKIDPKQILLNKGEYIALGVAGLFLLILLFSGVSMLADAKDPKEISANLSKSAQNVHSKIKGSQIADADLEATNAPAWATKPNRYPPVSANDFAITGPQFDPIAKPDTKKENPMVLAPGQKPFAELQVDLIRVPFRAYDIVPDASRGEDHYQIAVIVDKSAGKMSDEKMREFLKQMNKKQTKGKTGSTNLPANFSGPGGQPGPGGFGPGGQPGPGGFGPGGGGPGMGQGGRPGGMSGFGPGGRPPGMSGNGPGGHSYDQTAKRTAINYIPLEDLDKAMANGQTPAMTVIPLRGVLIHMEVPYKKQVEELKRALRLNSDEEAMRVGPIYEGYDVERKVSRTLPDGKLEEMIPWTRYNFEDAYQKLINSKKLEDSIEDGFLSYFIRYDMSLVLPLPKLVTELGHYPEISLPNIAAAIDKLKKAGLPKVEASDMVSRLSGKKPANDLYQPQTGNETGAAPLFGSSFNGPGSPGKNSPSKPSGGNNQEAAPPTDLDYLLLRFVDVDIEPGLTYEYRIRLKMKNPNEDKPDEVGNPEDAKLKTLYSAWTQISDKISIPTENYVFAADVATYRETIDKTYTTNKEKDLKEKLQAKDNQIVVEMCKWMAEVVVSSGKREPVGAWVVADIPLSRGEFVGRKQYVKLPLWSSETKSYILREINATTINGKKETNQPKGWIVDFTSPDILVDFTGGKVSTRLNGRNVSEDVDTELLIVSPDGKLTVKKSHDDEQDPQRKKILDVWTKWVNDVETKSKGPAPGEETNTFGGPTGGK